MGHWARIDENNIVQEVLVIKEAMLIVENYYGYDKSVWIKTSYNTRNGKHYEPADYQNFTKESSDQSKAIRFNYCSVGWHYDPTHDVFYPPAPPIPDFIEEGLDWAWVLNKTTWNWEIPVPLPEDGKPYRWDNDVYKADNTKGWVLNMPDNPFPSWTWVWDKEFRRYGEWMAPIPQPTYEKPFRWDEDLYQSDNTKGWIEVDPVTGKDI